MDDTKQKRGVRLIDEEGDLRNDGAQRSQKDSCAFVPLAGRVGNERKGAKLQINFTL